MIMRGYKMIVKGEREGVGSGIPPGGHWVAGGNSGTGLRIIST